MPASRRRTRARILSHAEPYPRSWREPRRSSPKRPTCLWALHRALPSCTSTPHCVQGLGAAVGMVGGGHGQKRQSPPGQWRALLVSPWAEQPSGCSTHRHAAVTGSIVARVCTRTINPVKHPAPTAPDATPRSTPQPVHAHGPTHRARCAAHRRSPSQACRAHSASSATPASAG